MKCYKLTNIDQTTKNKTRFEIGVPVYVKGMSPKLCSDGWIHFYRSPLIAVLMNPVHANFNPFLMWECKTGGKQKHEGLKSGCKVLTITKQIEPPTITLESKVAFGILCAVEVYGDPKWIYWAKNWLSGEDRTRQSANAANTNALATAYSACAAKAAGIGAYAASVGAYATSIGAYAAYANACATNADAAKAAAYAATNAAASAANANTNAGFGAYAASAATNAANAATKAATYAKHIDFVALAEKALTIS